MASVAAARYTVYFKDPAFDFHFLDSCLEGLSCPAGHYGYQRKQKGTSQMDLRPGIYECRITADGSLEFLVDASSGGNIKPALLINALWRFAGQQRPPYFAGTALCAGGRTAVHSASAGPGRNLYQHRYGGISRFVPLDEVGKIFERFQTDFTQTGQTYSVPAPQ